MTLSVQLDVSSEDFIRFEGGGQARIKAIGGDDGFMIVDGDSPLPDCIEDDWINVDWDNDKFDEFGWLAFIPIDEFVELGDEIISYNSYK